METNAIDTKAAPNQKSGIALLLKTRDKSSLPSPDVSFANILNEKTVPVLGTSGDTNVPVNNVKSVSGQKGESEAVEVKEGSDKEPATSDLKEVSRFDLALIEAALAGTSGPVIPQPAPEVTEQETLTRAAASEIRSTPAPEKAAPTDHSLSISVMRNVTRSTDTLKPINLQSAENLLTTDLSSTARAAHKAEKEFVNRVATAATAEQAVHKTENAAIIPATAPAPAAKANRSAESATVKNTVVLAPTEKGSQIAEISIMNPVATYAAEEHTANKTESASIIPAIDPTSAGKSNQATETTSIIRTTSMPVKRSMIMSTDAMKRVNPQSAENVLANDLAAAAERTGYKADDASIIPATDLTQAENDNRETELITVNRKASIPVIQNTMQSAEKLLTTDLTHTAQAAYKAEAAFVNHVTTAATIGQADHKTDTAQIGAGADRRPAASDGHGEKTLSISRMDTPATAEKAGHKMEAVSMNRVTEMLRQKDVSPAPETILSQIRRTVIALHENRQPTVSPKDMAAAAEMQQPVPAPAGTSSSEASISPATPGHGESVELLHDAVFMKDAAATVADSANGNDRNKNMGTINQAKSAGHETILFRIDASGIQALSETGTAVSAGSAGIRTQAVIDQIIDAKQAMGNDFGRVRIVLDPPNLGTVDLSIIVRKDRVGVVMTADNESVQQVLQSHMNDIRAAFQRQDLRIETFQVIVQDNGGSQQQFNGGAMFEQHREYQSRQTVSDDAPVIPVPSSIEGAAPAKGLVSVFV